MAWENLGKVVTLPAAADLSSSQFCAVNVNSSAQAALAGAGDDAVGVLQNKPAAASRAADVMIGAGVTKVKAGAATTNGGAGTPDSSGRMVDATSGDYICGEFLEAATAPNQFVAFLWQPKASKL